MLSLTGGGGVNLLYYKALYLKMNNLTITTTQSGNYIG